ncbi:PDR/VanB family oxidoreductase [Azospirillum sp. B506]|uniref:PDR/VanB family oxidoreductase n=1 Tax=Azospirillum sp. B506 TaxID=137721 RepID=UPI00034B613C|nr:PDR/VanB family oxidoreductase [Azospirillum sp. B506]
MTVRIGERPDTRSYSVVGPCRDSVYRIAVKRMPQSRGGSAYLWSLAPGARLSITPPRNLFPLAHGRPDYLLVAGGIGITPIYSMALALAEKGAETGADKGADKGAAFRLLYGCRSRGDLAFAEELRGRIGDRLEVAVEEEGQRLDLPGAVAALDPGGEMYVCGPIGLLDAVRRLWRDSGRPAANLRFETFGNTGRFAAEPFTVRIPRLGLELQVPQNRTMLDALEAAGVAMISDCRRGECGLCTVKVLEVDGALDHRDVFFSDRQKDEGKRMCTCVSRAVQGGVTIDTADRSL